MSTLTASDGQWTNGASLTRQWQRCNSDGTGCQDIDGASAPTYILTQSDEGHAIGLQVTATNLTGSTRASAKPTAVVAPVLPVNTHRPVITGTAQRSARLSSGEGRPLATASFGHRCSRRSLRRPVGALCGPSRSGGSAASRAP
jgi:hypothetical protein